MGHILLESYPRYSTTRVTRGMVPSPQQPTRLDCTLNIRETSWCGRPKVGHGGIRGKPGRPVECEQEGPTRREGNPVERGESDITFPRLVDRMTRGYMSRERGPAEPCATKPTPKDTHRSTNTPVTLLDSCLLGPRHWRPRPSSGHSRKHGLPATRCGFGQT